MPAHRRPSPLPLPLRNDRSDVHVSRRALLAGVGGAGLTALLAACTSGSSTASAPRSTTATSAAGTTPATTAAPSTSAAAPATSAPATTAAPTSSAPARTVAVHSFIGDGAKVGVGMPVILSVDPMPTDATAFVKAATVTVNGAPVQGAWYWSRPLAGLPAQAHFRTPEYWPANSTVKVDLPIGGLSAGKGLVFSDALTSLTFTTGDKQVTNVDGKTLRATVLVNDKVVRTMKVSLGAPKTPTFDGIKVVMQKGEDDPKTGKLRPDGNVDMQDTGHNYNELVPWSVRITTSGEYMHAASWNHHLGVYSSSNGCTNLSTADGKWYYAFANVGDIVVHTNTGGQQLANWNGYTDWNIPWATYSKGGLLPPNA